MYHCLSQKKIYIYKFFKFLVKFFWKKCKIYMGDYLASSEDNTFANIHLISKRNTLKDLFNYSPLICIII